ncbi:MAG: cyclic nucleotide-binding domain-containing protein [Desulfarculus sp.]|nr:cyclic nucleotide-binding domain-containing protein [Desulfarculus sp.]
MQGFWQRALNIFPQERGLALRLGLVFLGLFLAVAFWRNYVDSAFIKRYGVQEMPFMLLVNGLLTFALLGWLGRLGRRLDDARLLAGFVLSYALIVLGLYFLAGREVSAAYAILFQLLYLQDSVLLVYLWNIASDRFDPRQGRRLFPLFTAAQVLGTVLGNFLTHPLQTAADPNLSLVLFGLVWLSLGLYLASGTLGPAQAHAAPASPGQPMPWSRILDLARTYPVVRFLLVLGLLPNLLLPIFTYLFSVIANHAFASEAELMSFLGLFRGAMSLAIFVALAVASRLYSRLGLATASLAQPICFSLVFAGLGLAFNIYLAALGQFAVRLVQQAIAGPVNKVLFGLVPAEAAHWCRVFVRGTVVKIGVLLSSLVMMLLSEAPPRLLVAVALVLSAWWLAETWRFRRRYQHSLKQVIGADLPDYDRLLPANAGYHLADPVEVEQPTSAGEDSPAPPLDPAQALPFLDDPELAVRVQAARAFARSPEPRAIHRLLILLDDQEAARRAAIEALAAAGPAAQPLLTGALLSASPRVQRGILEVLRRAGLRDFDPLPFVGRQALAVYDRLAALAVLRRQGHSPSLALLATHLEQVNQRSLGLIFQALWVRHADMRLMYSALRTAQAAAVVELVESVLSPALARYLVPLIDTIPLAAKVEKGRRMLPVQQPAGLVEALNQLAHAADPLTRALAAFAMGQHQPGQQWLPTAAALLFDDDQGVRWAATFAVRRCTGREAPLPEAIDHMDKLKGLTIFAGLSLAEIMAVVQLGRKVALTAGQVLLSADQPSADLYVIVEGRVGLYRGPADSSQAPMAQLGAGDVLGAVGLFTQSPPRLSAAALETGQALVIRGSELEEAMLLYPQIAVNLCRHLASRLQAAGLEQA